MISDVVSQHSTTQPHEHPSDLPDFLAHRRFDFFTHDPESVREGNVIFGFAGGADCDREESGKLRGTDLRRAFGDVCGYGRGCALEL